ncbi:guanylate kinase [Agrilactobacillus fermenti]|uniref:guanylate kinase n=1 Tax=Agrilactobacillus fermenti TaxID=2586909 RepID=UPI001E2A8186|nr:guanylate kinase [Agrilactobacillus fermenti]
MMRTQERHLIVITGAAGTGKTTVSHYLEQQFGVTRVLTHTTRSPRQGETDGVDYYFETEASFFKNHFIEHVTYGGHLYGSSEEGLERAFKKNRLVCLVLDTAGAQTYLQRFPELVTILYLTVNDPDQLKERMVQRGDSVTALQQRIHSDEYIRDLQVPTSLQRHVKIIVNDHWQATTAKLNQLMLQLDD